MELEAVSSCCSSSSPSVPSSSTSREDVANRTELEAAETLADLAQLAIMPEQAFESAVSWGRKGKRVRKRVTDEFTRCDSPLKPADSEALPRLDLSEEQTVKEEQDVQPVTRDLTTVPVKSEVDDETPKPYVTSALKCRSSGRSRQNLSEAEREERRIKRILANRESARQTILRRQALCEELTRKAADLTYENGNLRREKDRALKEFQSLETINKHLKEQVSKSVIHDIKEPEESLKSSQVEMSTSSTPVYFYNQNPFQLFYWPHITQSSDPTKSPLEPQNGFTTPSTTSGRSPDKIMTSQVLHTNPGDDHGQNTPIYIVPCPWFLPPYQSNEVPTIVPLELQDTQGARIKEEDSCSTKTKPLYDLNESASEVLSEGDTLPMAFPNGQAYILKHEDVSQSTNEVKPMAPGHHVLISLPTKTQGFVECPSKKLVGSVAAAEARKRRKQLTRLKNLHGRQCQMQV